jgi:hypothetical protein
MTFFSQACRTCGTTHFIRLCTILHATGFGIPPNFEDCCKCHNVWFFLLFFFSQACRTCGTTHFIRLCTILHATGFGIPPNFEDCCKCHNVCFFLLFFFSHIQIIKTATCNCHHLFSHSSNYNVVL